MRRLLLARLAQSLIVVAVVTTVSFFVIRLAPGDPFNYASPRVTEQVREQWRHQFGYDQPLVVQFARYLGSVARGRRGRGRLAHAGTVAALGAGATTRMRRSDSESIPPKAMARPPKNTTRATARRCAEVVVVFRTLRVAGRAELARLAVRLVAVWADAGGTTAVQTNAASAR